ncbi:TIGR02281 family clan AA aspartic protease [Candidatus Omnitrophota bacterium]
MQKVHKFSIILIAGSFFVFLLSGCSTLKVAGKTLGVASRATFATAKTVGKVAFNTAKLTGKGIKTVVNMTVGKEVVKLEKKCNTLYVDTVLNRKLKTKLILDTGCSNTQISSDIAKKLGIKTRNASKVSCQLADGRTVTGRAVNIKEVKLGRAKVKNVRAIVLEKEEGAGLLGMSFLDNFVFKVDTEKKELVLQKR